MTILSVLAGVFGIVMRFANVPQIYKIFKTKSAKDISVITYILLALGSIVWVLYGIELWNIPILIMNGLALIEFLIILVGFYIYGKE